MDPFNQYSIQKNDLFYENILNSTRKNEETKKMWSIEDELKLKDLYLYDPRKSNGSINWKKIQAAFPEYNFSVEELREKCKAFKRKIVRNKSQKIEKTKEIRPKGFVHPIAIPKGSVNSIARPQVASYPIDLKKGFLPKIPINLQPIDLKKGFLPKVLLNSNPYTINPQPSVRQINESKKKVLSEEKKFQEFFNREMFED